MPDIAPTRRPNYRPGATSNTMRGHSKRRSCAAQGNPNSPQGSELGLTGFTSCGKAESMGLVIRSLPDGRLAVRTLALRTLALRTRATFAVAASAGPLFPD